MERPSVDETRYQTGALLGRGGMAEVYAGVDTRLGRPVAIKRLRDDLAANPVLRSRFWREARAAAGLDHPGIVAVLDTAEVPPSTGASPTPIIVMELVDGGSLRESLRDSGIPELDRALEITSGVLSALSSSHSAGIVHRDIKPANVLLTSTGQVKVADFGIARSMTDTSATVTQPSTVMGTAHYMSPEQARGLPVDQRSDLYSVGCLLYELVVGRPPFTGESALSIAYQHVADLPVTPSTLDPRLPADLDAVLLKALQKDADDRYQTAAEMSADIDHVRSGLPLPAAPSGATPDARVQAVSAARPGSSSAADRTANRRGGASVVGLVVLLLIGISTLGYSWLPARQSAILADVPAVLGSGQSRAESLLHNADLVPRVVLARGGGATAHTAGFTDVVTHHIASRPPGAAADAVTAVEPGEGRTVALGARITITSAVDEVGITIRSREPATAARPGNPARPTTGGAGHSYREPSHAATGSESDGQKRAENRRSSKKQHAARPKQHPPKKTAPDARSKH